MLEKRAPIAATNGADGSVAETASAPNRCTSGEADASGAHPALSTRRPAPHAGRLHDCTADGSEKRPIDRG
ncbi:MAG: hypothetical protein ACR2JO_04680 [Mycobacteriales bacterium]